MCVVGHFRAEGLFAQFIVSVMLLVSLFCSPRVGASPIVSLTGRDQHGWVRVRGEGVGTNELITLSASSNLVDWQTIAVLHANSFEFVDPASTDSSQRFYRFNAAPLTPASDWKNQIGYPYEPYYGDQGGPHAWVKFVIFTADPTRVFYADSSRYTFHHDFAAARLEPLIGISPQEFERISFFNEGRQVLLGTVLNPGYPRTEYGIQFVSNDPLPRELVREMFELVKSTVIPDPLSEPGVEAFYMPTFEQSAAAHSDAAYFASNGIPLSSPGRWVREDTCYSEGWAIGILKFFSATNVATAYADGRLRPEDILITDGIPAELPYVSGIITLTPTTANSHVSILAQSYGVPFAYLLQEAEQSRVLQLTNREIVLQAVDVDFGRSCEVLILPIDPPLQPAVRTELLALKTGPAFQLTPKERYGDYTAPTDNLVPADIKYFGGKAANYGLLRRVIPSNSQPAIAISFDLWDDFLNQPLGTGRTLRNEIRNRLAGFTYPPDVAAVQTRLAEIRTLIRNSTHFPAAQQEAITNALSVFDRRRNIRFRSSTNVEDAESFSGAGLYDSYSGCLADDQDSDNAGPSICDPTEEDERGIFRAIRRVYASFYNDNAYLERLRLGVNETNAGMAILVHHSTPDQFEMANGVLTGRWWQDISGQPPTFGGILNTQTGAVSVANPDGSAIPEELRFSKIRGRAPYFSDHRSSSLVRLGDYVMEWDQDYTNLAELAFLVGQGYTNYVTKPRFNLDIEYKKVRPGVLELKQVREIPETLTTNMAPYVVNDSSVTFANWHGFYDDVWMAHWLKSRWTLRHRTVSFTETNLAQGFYTELTIEHRNGTNIHVLHGPISSFSNALHEAFSEDFYLKGYVRDRWTMDTAVGPAEFELTTRLETDTVTKQPFRVLSDLVYYGLDLELRFPTPVFIPNPPGEPFLRTNASTRLYPLRAERKNDLFLESSFDIAGQGTNIIIRSSYWLPEEARGDDCRCPILRIVESRIEGFTSEPLVLRGYWSQTYENSHHGGGLGFIFEPRLEPGLSPQQMQELEAANVAVIYVSGNGPALTIVGLDGSARRF